VDSVVVEEVGKCFHYVFLIVDVSFGVAEGAADEQRGSIADVT
jgi:hypothetical protein